MLDSKLPIIIMIANSLGGDGYSRSCLLLERIILYRDQIEKLVDNIDLYIKGKVVDMLLNERNPNDW